MRVTNRVRIIGPRGDGSYYRACAKCGAELNPAVGEWVPDYPGRPIHGYRTSQLFSTKVDPGEILTEYRSTRYPDRFYNLKIGIPWADLERRLDPGSILSLVGGVTDWNDRQHYTVMGVDTGKDLHVIILRASFEGDEPLALLVAGVCSDFEDLDWYMERYRVERCVIDGQPETHATRAFAHRFMGLVYLNYFSESQRGSARWDYDDLKVEVNRTEALDASRAVVRERRLVIPGQLKNLDTFVRHMAADAKVLDEYPDTGAKKYRYVRTGEDHFSLAFTYARVGSATA